MSTFFSLSLSPNLQYTTILEDDLTLTRAVIDPSAMEDSVARLFMKVGGREFALCQLTGTYTTAPLNIPIIASETKISFRIAGNVPLHISGYYPPKREEPTEPQINGFMLGGSM